MKNYVLALLLTVPTFVWSENMSVSVGASTFGVTIVPEYRINKNLALRAPFGTAGISGKFTDNGITLTGNARISGAALLADYYPTNGGIRISGGLAIPRYQVVGKKASRIDFNGKEYTLDYFRSEVNTSNFAPMLGVGYSFDRTNRRDFYATVDLGAIMNVKYEGSYEYSGLKGKNAALFEDQADQYLSDSLNNLNENAKFLPFVSLSLGYRF